MNSNKEKIGFKEGISDGIPIGLGYISVSFAFGIFAVSSGLTVWQTLLISMLNLTSAGQLAGVPIIAGAGSLFELGLTQLIINLRYSLMSISLSQRLDKSVKIRDRFWISFANTDEVFAVSTGRGEMLGRTYFVGLVIPPYLGWTFGTLIGAIAGNVLPAIITGALTIAIYAMLIAIVVPVMKKSLPTALAALVAIALSCVFYYTPVLNKIPSGFAIVICAVLVSTVFALIAPIKDAEKCEEAE